MIDRNYIAHHAATLLKLARSTKNPDVAAALIAKAADLKARVDDANFPDVTSHASDVEPSAAP